MELEDIGACGFHRPFPRLKQVAMVSICTHLLTNGANHTVLEELPDVLKEECRGMYQRIQYNFTHMLDVHHQFVKNVLDSGNSVVWSPFGTVDLTETFRRNKQLIPYEERFDLACYLSDEEELLTVFHKDRLQDDCDDMCSIGDVELNKVFLAYWMKFFANIPPRPAEISNIILVCVERGYFHPMPYFWDQLTDEECDEALAFFISNKLDWLDVADVDTVDAAVFLVNKMSETQRDEFFKKRPVQILKSLSHFYCVADFVKKLRYFLVKQYVNVPDAFGVCLEFFSDKFYDPYGKKLSYKYKSHELYRESAILVLQDTCCSRDDLIETFYPLYFHYGRILQAKCVESSESTQLTQISVINNVVARIVRDFAEYNRSLETTYKEALEEKTSEAFAAFMDQFVRTFKPFCERPRPEMW